ncbi:hypothetical protein UE98_22335 [Burkholderia cenocepacia]|nr:hypothetical protein UE98_22335 [Burkholderia cenocepacia]
MSNYAVVQDDVVVNVVVWDGDETAWRPPEGCQAVEVPDGIDVSIGYGYADGNFLAPSPAAIPTTDDDATSSPKSPSTP